ncbi:MAG: hypothetical protein AAGD13_18720 [Pseudomonadota bacterium]
MHFFIEMGQGIIRKSAFHVSTSTLFSCTLIAGIGNGGFAGAFHYPTNALERTPDCVKDMNLWASTLQPTQIILVHALNANAGMGAFGAMSGGTPVDDKRALRQWALQKCGTPPTVKEGVHTGMELTSMGAFAAGPRDYLESRFSENSKIRLDTKPAGHYLDHGGYGLVGKNRETN